MSNKKPGQFYISRIDYLDNTAPFAIRYRGRLWPTLEHAYQAAKFDDQEIINAIHAATSPYEAKRIAHHPKNAHNKRYNWGCLKVGVMRELIHLKTEQHALVCEVLLETCPHSLCEASTTDAFWGSGPDGKGQNKCGELWMDERNALRCKLIRK